MLSNMNQKIVDGLNGSSIMYYNSHSGKNNEAKEFSIYRPDVDFSINYEPVSADKTHVVNNAKETSTLTVDASTAAGNFSNGNRAVTMYRDITCPTSLHNYSKVPESISLIRKSGDNNNNKDLEDNEADFKNRDDNNNASNKIDDNRKPEHHVRRPMNAFLIFCKRHRALVREKYPNLENRSITKILGDWWAFLGNEDKAPYKELAKNYKDVFFSKNPNFKWYKLPAPPLRTLLTRPNNDRERSTSLTSPLVEEILVENTSDRSARAVKLPGKNSSGIGQFKLASIDQMGGLSSLMLNLTPTRVNDVVFDDVNNDKNSSKSDNDSHSKKYEKCEMMDVQEDDTNSKTRACKGKRYEQFMTPTKKSTKQKNSISLSATTNQFPHNGYCKQDYFNAKNEDSSDDVMISVDVEDAEAKSSDAADFKLNDKIMTLPSLDLDDYLNRKKAMKKKKKFSGKNKHRQQQAQSSRDKIIPKPTIVGSQKRKAPKQTIRRTTDIIEQEISRVGLIGLDTLATIAVIQANASPQ